MWLGTGEATTNADAYLGSGVYVLSDPHHGSFSTRSRVGGHELESTTIHELRFGGGKVWAATSEGVWSHSAKKLGGAWKLEYAPNPDYLPGGSKADDPDAAYKNITNDIAIDPKNPAKVVLAVGWRSGDDYNGFYTRVNGTWTRITSGFGDLPTDADNVGSVTFARSADGSRYYAIDQSPEQLNTNPDSGLEGIYVSRSGSPGGPWTKIADYQGLAASGSALTDPGYMPGVQAWYNQFLTVDPADPEHVYAGLEEVYETKNGGSSWSTVGPYWNFGFPAGASTRPSRPVTATRPPTPTSTASRSAATTAGVSSTRATTAASTSGPSTAPRTPPGTPPTGPRSTTAPSTPSSTTRSVSARTWTTAASPSPADSRTTASRSCAATTR